MQKRHLIFVLVSCCAAIVGLLATLWPSAALAGGVVGDGTPASCTTTALRTALMGGGTVTFNCGGPKTILVTLPMTITQNTVILGGGIITLTAGLGRSLFYVVSPASLALDAIRLDSAYSPNSDGGAIRASGRLTLTNVTIQNSRAGSGYCGGAIWTNGGAYIANSIFYKNGAGFGGGAICTGTFNTPTIQIANSSFTSNYSDNPSAGYGGAIYVNTNANLDVVDSLFTINTAVDGGALYVNTGGNATLRTDNVATTTTFAGNTVSDDGGAIHNQGNLDIYKVNIVSNKAPTATILAGYGGAIHNRGTLYLYAGFVAFNEGRFGGALFSGNSLGTPRTTVDSSVIYQNRSGALGGGLYVNTGAVMTVTNSRFVANSVDSANGGCGCGGGAARFNARLSIMNSSFTDNQSAGAGGALISDYGPDADPSYVTVTSVTFSGNTSGTHRGGGFSNRGYAILKNVTLKDNTNGIYNSGTTHLGNSVLDNPGSLNCDGDGTPIASDGHNLSTDGSCALEQNGIPAQLGPRVLESTYFHLPLSGSPLINAAAACPTRDQRGATRVGTCDIGAVEYGGLTRRALLPFIRR